MSDRVLLARLQSAAYASTWDRLSIAPLMVLIASQFASSIEATAMLSSAYVAGYGLAQFGWAAVADRIGHGRVIRLGMITGGCAAGLAALAPTFGLLLASRILGGVAMAGVIPGVLVLVSHHYAGTVSVAAGNVMTSVYLSTASAPLLTGVMASAVGWRAAFGAVAVGSLAVGIVLGRLPDTQPNASRSRLWKQAIVVLRKPSSAAIVALGVFEGIVIPGCIVLVVPIAQHNGTPPWAAALLIAAFGAFTALATQALRFAQGWSRRSTVIVGAAIVAIGWWLQLLSAELWVGIACCALIGTGYATTHLALQTSALTVLKAHRGLTMSLFVAGALVGSATGTAVGAAAIANLGAASFFAIAGGSSLMLAVTAAIVLRSSSSPGIR